VVKRFPGAARPAVSQLTLEVPRGELVALVGPSGCGKTTTLKMINRLIEPTSGRIEVDGLEVTSAPVHELRRRIGYVIQQAGLFPHRSVAANIGTVPRLLGWSKARTRERVEELVDLVGLDRDLLGRYPSALSGGQQQRVGVARALAADPPILLMDEPYSAVDPIVRAHLQDELLALQARLQKTVVLVTHDIDEAIKLANRIALLNVGGILEQVGTPEEVLRAPATPFVEAFLGRERGLKRLALHTVGELSLPPGPVVQVEASAREAEDVMAAHGTDWVGVLDSGDRLLGWVWKSDLAAAGTVAALDLRPFRATVHAGATLREALDVIVNSATGVAVVLDGERYVGMVRLEQVSEGLG